LAQEFFQGTSPEFLDLHWRRWWSRGKVSRRSAEGARRSQGERKNTTIKT